VRGAKGVAKARGRWGAALGAATAAAAASYWRAVPAMPQARRPNARAGTDSPPPPPLRSSWRRKLAASRRAEELSEAASRCCCSRCASAARCCCTCTARALVTVHGAPAAVAAWEQRARVSASTSMNRLGGSVASRSERSVSSVRAWA
jgi:hypothetical protein